MDEVVDRIMNSIEIGSILTIENHEEIRAKIGKYIATLSSAGRNDVDQLAEYGFAYLRELQEGPDSRYTGC